MESSKPEENAVRATARRKPGRRTWTTCWNWPGRLGDIPGLINDIVANAELDAIAALTPGTEFEEEIVTSEPLPVEEGESYGDYVLRVLSQDSVRKRHQDKGQSLYGSLPAFWCNALLATSICPAEALVEMHKIVKAGEEERAVWQNYLQIHFSHELTHRLGSPDPAGRQPAG